MRKSIIYVFVFALMLAACGTNNAKEQLENIIRPTGETVINYSEDGENDTEIYSYTYEKQEDRFWQKAIVRDADGKEIRSINREIDPETRLPIKEYTIDELGEIDEYITMKYDPKTCLLLDKITYKGEIKPENIIEEIHNTYINGVLDKQHYITRSTDKDYKNAAGNNITDEIKFRFLPSAETRGKGNIETFYKIEKRNLYLTDKLIKRLELSDGAKPGDLYFTEETKFDKLGYPAEYTSTDPNAGTEHRFSKEYYQTKVDKYMRLLEFVPFSDAEKTKLAKNALKYIFEYDKSGKNIAVVEMMLNDENQKFDLMHGRNRFAWNNPFPQQLELADAAINGESFCQHRKVYSKRESVIEKFNNKEKITVVKTASMDGGFPKNELPGKVVQRATVKFQTIKIK